MIVEEFVINLSENSKNKSKSESTQKTNPHVMRHLFHKKVISRIFHYLSSKRIRIFIFRWLKKIGFLRKRNYKIIDISCEL